jgi:HD-GYP domain-containing protein (c-di-GMP phosphodiesterase class II)
LPKIAVAEAVVPHGVVDGLRELGYGIWFLPRGEAVETLRLLQEFPPDVVILPDVPETEQVAVVARESYPALRVLVAANEPRIPSEIPGWADLVIASEADLTFWMLAMMALVPLDRPQGEIPGRGRQTLFTVIDAAHRGLRSIEREAPGNRVLGKLRDRLEQSFELLLRIILDQLEREVEGFGGHSARVSDLSRRLAVKLGLPRGGVEAAATAGLLHDVGMHLVVPPDAMRRSGALNLAEWEVIRAHPAASALSVSPLRSAAGATAAIREHHERLDGSGYPMGKKGEDLSASGRVVAVADTYDALVHPRPHRPALTTDRALETLAREAKDGRLDPDATEALPLVAPKERPVVRAVRLEDVARNWIEDAGSGASERRA